MCLYCHLKLYYSVTRFIYKTNINNNFIIRIIKYYKLTKQTIVLYIYTCIKNNQLLLRIARFNNSI